MNDFVVNFVANFFAWMNKNDAIINSWCIFIILLLFVGTLVVFVIRGIVRGIDAFKEYRIGLKEVEEFRKRFLD